MTNLMARASDLPPPTRATAALDDVELLQRVAAGDVAAQELLWRSHVDAVYRVCASQVPAPDAEDAVAETFLAAFAGAGSFDPLRGTIRSWLLGIAVNQLRRGWRADRRIAATLQRVRSRGRDTSTAHDHADAVIARVDAVDLRAALAQLSDGDRLVLVTQAAGDLSPAELAAALSTNTGAAKVRLHRARHRLACIVDPSSIA